MDVIHHAWSACGVSSHLQSNYIRVVSWQPPLCDWLLNTMGHVKGTQVEEVVGVFFVTVMEFR